MSVTVAKRFGRGGLRQVSIVTTSPTGPSCIPPEAGDERMGIKAGSACSKCASARGQMALYPREARHRGVDYTGRCSRGARAAARRTPPRPPDAVATPDLRFADDSFDMSTILPPSRGGRTRQGAQEMSACAGPAGRVIIMNHFPARSFISRLERLISPSRFTSLQSDLDLPRPRAGGLHTVRLKGEMAADWAWLRESSSL